MRRDTGMYYGGEPAAWTTQPDIIPEALFENAAAGPGAHRLQRLTTEGYLAGFRCLSSSMRMFARQAASSEHSNCPRRAVSTALPSPSSARAYAGHACRPGSLDERSRPSAAAQASGAAHPGDCCAPTSRAWRLCHPAERRDRRSARRGRRRRARGEAQARSRRRRWRRQTGQAADEGGGSCAGAARGRACARRAAHVEDLWALLKWTYYVREHVELYAIAACKLHSRPVNTQPTPLECAGASNRTPCDTSRHQGHPAERMATTSNPAHRQTVALASSRQPLLTPMQMRPNTWRAQVRKDAGSVNKVTHAGTPAPRRTRQSRRGAAAAAGT
jgi:hypothetical protein